MGVEEGDEPTPDGRVGTMLIANAFHLALGMVFLALGVAVLLDTGILLATAGGSTAVIGALAGNLAIALGLVAVGGAHLRLAARHWTFRFRGDAVSLAGPPLHPMTTKDERKARARDFLRMMIRTGVKAPPMPGGLVGEFVNVVAPRLNLAQAPIRLHAYRQLRRALNLVLVLVGVVMAWIVADPTVFPVMAAFYFLVAVAVLRPDEVFRPQADPADLEEALESPLPHPGRAVALLVLAVLAPAGLSYLASGGIALPGPWLAAMDGLALPTLAIALPALGGCALYFVALGRQTRGLKESEGSKWGSTQPYALPEVSQGLVRHIYDRLPASGTLLSWRFDKREEALYAGFLAEGEATLEPTEEADSLATALADAWRSPSSRALLQLDGAGLLLGLAGGWFAWLAASQGSLFQAAMALGLVAAAQSCMASAHKLWKRADFMSLVYEVDIEATYLENDIPPPRPGPGRIHVGSLRPDSELQLTSGNVRVRVLRMTSVQFEPRGRRFVTGIELDIGESTRLATAVDDYHAQVLAGRSTFLMTQDLLQA